MSKDPGRKDDLGKLRYDLLPASALEDVVKVLTYGATKYDDRNWEKGISWTRMFGAVMRHLWEWMKGSDIDPESELPHMAHATVDCLFLLQYARTRREFDDRPKTNPDSSYLPKTLGVWCPDIHMGLSGDKPGRKQ